MSWLPKIEMPASNEGKEKSGHEPKSLDDAKSRLYEEYPQIFDTEKFGGGKWVKALEETYLHLDQEYKKGNRLIDAKGSKWIWSKKGMFKEETNPIIEKYAAFLKPEYKKEFDDKKAKELSAQHSKERVKQNELLEEKYDKVIEQIDQDFGQFMGLSETGEYSNREFWQDVYKYLELGFLEYQKQETVKGFTLTNPISKEFVYFGPEGKPTEPELKTEVLESENLNDNPVKRYEVNEAKDAARKEIARIEFPEALTTLSDLEDKDDWSSADRARALNAMEQIAKKEPRLKAIKDQFYIAFDKMEQEIEGKTFGSESEKIDYIHNQLNGAKAEFEYFVEEQSKKDPKFDAASQLLDEFFKNFIERKVAENIEDENGNINGLYD